MSRPLLRKGRATQPAAYRYVRHTRWAVHCQILSAVPNGSRLALRTVLHRSSSSCPHRGDIVDPSRSGESIPVSQRIRVADELPGSHRDWAYGVAVLPRLWSSADNRVSSEYRSASRLWQGPGIGFLATTIVGCSVRPWTSASCDYVWRCRSCRSRSTTDGRHSRSCS